MAKKDKTLGQVAYETHREHFLTVFGHKPREWKSLSAELKAKWEKVGEAVGTVAAARLAKQFEGSLFMP